ncbi:hypothetical protein FKM82_013393 [Ascaphus truei]
MYGLICFWKRSCIFKSTSVTFRGRTNFTLRSESHSELPSLISLIHGAGYPQLSPPWQWSRRVVGATTYIRTVCKAAAILRLALQEEEVLSFRISSTDWRRRAQS